MFVLVPLQILPLAALTAKPALGNGSTVIVILSWAVHPVPKASVTVIVKLKLPLPVGVNVGVEIALLSKSPAPGPVHE